VDVEAKARAKLRERAATLNGTTPDDETPVRPRFRILSDVELEALPTQPPLIEGLFARNSLVSAVGLRSSYKTFWLIDLMMCIATNTPWLGRAVHQGPVLYICAEGAYGMRARVAAWKQANLYEGSAPVWFIPQRVPFSDPSATAELLQLLKDWPTPPVLVVIDTVARNFSGDENAQQDMSRFVAGCDRLREATEATIIGAHHMGWVAERSRGSSVLPDAADTEFTLTKDGNRLSVKVTKQKDGPQFPDVPEIHLSAVPCAGSLVLVGVGPNDRSPTANESKALRALQRESNADGATFAAWERVSGLAHGSFANARTALLDAGYVECVDKRYRLTSVGRSVLPVQQSNASPTAEVDRQDGLVQQSTPLYEGMEFGLESGYEAAERAGLAEEP
jgi:AAA domain-containing protein